MSKKMNVLYAAIGAAVFFGTPALAATSYHVRHDIPVKDHTSPGIRTATVRNRQQAYASAPETMRTNDPTMYPVHHDIPVKDHTSPK